MPQATREIKRRIRSIKNTRQITRAMEMVSAAKMRKAVARVLSTRSYATLAWGMLIQLASKKESALHPLLVERIPVERVGLIVISSNRGLAGAFNQVVAQRVLQYVSNISGGNNIPQVDLFVVGKRGGEILVRRGQTVVAEFTKPDVTKEIEEILPLAKMVLSDYMAGKYDRVVMAYTDFVSPVSQKPRLKQLLPLTKEIDEYLGEGRLSTAKTESQNEATLRVVSRRDKPGTNYNYEYIFEPSPKAVLDDLLPRLLEMQVFQATLESDASEHSARML
ncbi:MAG: ATP synthase F1 subunit gamma, partial [Patescibacteria group bacterium]